LQKSLERIMPRVTVLHGERQEGRRENGEDADVKKYVEMLTQAGFQVAVSHAYRSLSWREGPRLRELLLGSGGFRDRKPFYADRSLRERPEETVKPGSQ
jgi:hypothetical protein